MLLIPEHYQAARSTLEFDSVAIGHFAIVVSSMEEIELEQKQFTVSWLDGSSLCHDTDGWWRPGWLYIGWDTLKDGPLILDTSDPNSRVLVCTKEGDGEILQILDLWEPAITIATTLDGFFQALRELKKMSVGRDTPDSLKANPVSAEERSAFLARVARICTDWEGEWYWESKLGSHKDPRQPEQITAT